MQSIWKVSTKKPKPRYKNRLKLVVEKRISKNRDILIVVCGPTGIGKTITAYALAHQFHPQFNETTWSKYVAFGSSEEFKERLKDQVEDGAPLILDETGVAVAAGDWMETFAKAFQAVMQVRRVKRRVIFFVLPAMPDTLKSIKRMVDYFIEINARHDRENYYSGSISKIGQDRFQGKTWRARPRFPTPDKPRGRKFSKIEIKGISAEWRKAIDDYGEAHKDIIFEKSGNKITASFHQKEQEAKAKETILLKPQEYVKTYNQRTFYDSKVIRSIFNLSKNSAEKVASELAQEHPEHLTHTNP